MERGEEKILIVEDEELARKNLEHILKKEGYNTVSVKSGVKAIELLNQQTFDLVLTDLKMEKVDGIEVLKTSRKLQPFTEVIMITGYATVDSAVSSMKKGAYHYLAKPYKIEEVRIIVREALLKRKLQLENQELRDSLGKSRTIPHLVGKSKAIQSVAETIRQVSPLDINVLILGESGTGKELE